MLPTFSDDLRNDFMVPAQPSMTYALQPTDSIQGHVSGLEAVKQTIRVMLNVERYDYEIYSWNYGAELKDLIGKPLPLVYSLIRQFVADALITDDRIISVDNFRFERSGSRVHVLFDVGTIFGSAEMEAEVDI